MSELVKVIGGGLAGCECALQLLKAGFAVKMYEMRPKKNTGAHSTDKLAELVCSNSLKSEEPTTASGLLKEEDDPPGGDHPERQSHPFRGHTGGRGADAGRGRECPVEFALLF